MLTNDLEMSLELFLLDKVPTDANSTLACRPEASKGMQ